MLESSSIAFPTGLASDPHLAVTLIALTLCLVWALIIAKIAKRSRCAVADEMATSKRFERRQKPRAAS